MTGAPLHLYDSLTRALVPFRPLNPARVRIYSCGPTVYNYAHLGNLRAYVFTDTLGRTLTWKGYPLEHVVNITDVGHLTSDADAGDDKLEAAARASGRDIWEISRHYTAAFKDNLAALNVRPPAHMPLATDWVPQMIAWAEAIAERHCYRLDDGLYFDVASVPDYGRLAGGAAAEAQGRIEAVAGKRQPHDFAIWRTTPPGETRQMEWDSPWGRGAPGWHLECSVMSEGLLGHPFDIHTGGVDHREIHHPNEIAQNQARCACPDSGARLWMHNNFLVAREPGRTGKMSKSSGEFLTLTRLTERGFHPLAYRLLCLQAHYRSELEFSWEGVAAAQVRLKRLVMTVEALRSKATKRHDAGREAHHRAALDVALSDDLNTPAALVVLDNILIDGGLLDDERAQLLQDCDDLLGLKLATLTRADLRVRPADAAITADEVAARLAERREARAAKDFARSDTIRDELAAAGVEVMDGDPLGWDWRAVV